MLVDSVKQSNKLFSRYGRNWGCYGRNKLTVTRAIMIEERLTVTRAIMVEERLTVTREILVEKRLSDQSIYAGKHT